MRKIACKIHFLWGCVIIHAFNKLSARIDNYHWLYYSYLRTCITVMEKKKPVEIKQYVFAVLIFLTTKRALGKTNINLYNSTGEISTK